MVAGAAVKLAAGLAGRRRLRRQRRHGRRRRRRPPRRPGGSPPRRLHDARGCGRSGALGARAVAGGGAATTGLLGLFLLANVDVLLARTTLDQAAAGQYALGAVVAEIAFWAPQFVVTVIFPRLVGAADPRRLLAGSALLITGFGELLAVGLVWPTGWGWSCPCSAEGTPGWEPLLPLFAALGTALALVQLLLFEGIATRDRRMGRAVAVALVAESSTGAWPRSPAPPWPWRWPSPPPAGGCCGAASAAPRPRPGGSVSSDLVRVGGPKAAPEPEAPRQAMSSSARLPGARPAGGHGRARHRPGLVHARHQAGGLPGPRPGPWPGPCRPGTPTRTWASRTSRPACCSR